MTTLSHCQFLTSAAAKAARARVTIAFDADNPGRWAFHCRNLYHTAADMMTTVEYET